MLKQATAAWRSYLLGERGVVAVEFAMVFLPFILSILFIAEMCRVVYLSSALDLILAESGQVASISAAPENYKRYFAKELNDRMEHWPLLSRSVDIDLSILYCDSIATVVHNLSGCSSSNALNKPLALYQVSIDYQPLFFIFPREFTIPELSRSITFVQEFQREMGEESDE